MKFFADPKGDFPGNKRGLPEWPLPLPALLVLVYAFLFWLLMIWWTCSRRVVPAGGGGTLVPADPDYGIPFRDMFGAVNILFALYLLLSLWSFATGPARKRVSQWAGYIFSILLVAAIQICLHMNARVVDAFRGT